MIKNIKYNNLDELKAGRALLDAEESRLSKEVIAEGKLALFALPVLSMLKPSDPLKAIKVDGEINIPAKVFSYLLPIIVNRTLFRRSNFMVKFVTAIIARNVGKRIGPKVTMWLIDMAGRQLKGLSTNCRKTIPERRLLRLLK